MNINEQLTLPTRGQVVGDDNENQLEILQQYGTKCAVTDFSILLGGYVAPNDYTSEGNSKKERAGWWWTRTTDNHNDAYSIDDTGVSEWEKVNVRCTGARPILPYSLISSIASNRVRGKNGILEVSMENTHKR